MATIKQQVFMKLVSNNNYEEVIISLINGFNPNFSINIESPLGIACEHNNIKMINILIPYMKHNDGFNKLTGNYEYSYPCLLGCENEQSVKLIISNKIEDINIVNSQGTSLLSNSIHYNLNIDFIEYLLKIGANPNLANFDAGITPFMQIFKLDKAPNQIIKLINLFIKYGAEINKTTFLGDTCLVPVIFNNNFNLLKLLLKDSIFKNLMPENSIFKNLMPENSIFKNLIPDNLIPDNLIPRNSIFKHLINKQNIYGMTLLDIAIKLNPVNIHLNPIISLLKINGAVSTNTRVNNLSSNFTDLSKNVLYLGMANDIMSPLILCPDLENLYVIDLFDIAYSSKKNVASQRNDIKQILIDGYKKIKNKQQNDKEQTKIHYLRYPSTIVKETIKKNVWKLIFKYGNKTRKLIVYNQSFTDVWPKEIKNIDTIIGIGAVGSEKNKILINMFDNRTNIVYNYWTNGYGYDKFYYPVHRNILNGKQREDQVAGIQIDKRKDLVTNLIFYGENVGL